MSTLGDGPVDPKYRDKMIEVVKKIDRFFNGKQRGTDREIGFVLLVFPFGEEPGGRLNFMSNGADRKDLAILFKEMIARFEGQPETKGKA